MNRPALLIACATMLAGCAAPQRNPAALTETELCKSFGAHTELGWRESAEAMRVEIVHRNLIPEPEWEIVRGHKIRVGMTKCAMYASWGRPDRENRTVSAGGESIQHVYRASRYSRGQYVYTRNGVVTSFQD